MTAEPSSPYTGVTLGGRYYVQHLIKAGGMGAVYAARDLKLQRPVAVKVLCPELTQDPSMVRRLFREARAASQIRHPNVVEYLDYDQIAGGPAYLVMELLDGEDLERVLRRRGPIPWPELAVWLREACQAIGAVHAAGIIHRDVKPSNFVLVDTHAGDRQELKLIDFGIVKVTARSSIHGDTDQTRYLLGTEAFMAPELFVGVAPNARTDVFALGVSMYRLLSGQFPRSMGPSLLTSSEFGTDVPVAASALIRKCIDENPSARYSSMLEVERAIAEIMELTEPSSQWVESTTAVVPDAGAAPSPWGGRPQPRVRKSRVAVFVGTLGLSTAFAWITAPETPAHEAGRPLETSEFCRVLGSTVAPTDEASCADESYSSPKHLPGAPQKRPADQQASVLVSTEGTEREYGLEQPRDSLKEDPDSVAVSRSSAVFSSNRTLAVLRQLEATARQCGELDRLIPGTEIELVVTVSSEGKGRATKSRLVPDARSVRCIMGLVRRARFPRSGSGGRVKYTFKM